jgi:hydrogenase maturation protease
LGLVLSFEELTVFLDNDISGRIMFIGIGSEIRGDEVAVKIIIEKISTAKIENIAAIWTDTRPENFLKKIEEFKPDQVIFFQASKFGGKPGETKFLRLDDHDEKSLHESPIITLSHYLKNQIGAKASLVVVEPKSLNVGDISDEMLMATDRISNNILNRLGKKGSY